jgi:porphobilinogen synthase
MLPVIRPRRLRKEPWIRDLIAETHLSVADLIYPIFITAGSNIAQEVVSMPGIFVYSIDNMLIEVQKAIDLGIKAINIFPKIAASDKNSFASGAVQAENNLVCQAVAQIKERFTNKIGVICDVALDPYTSHGHDGVLNEQGLDVDNDKTLQLLAQQSLLLCQSGADFVSPSDMMDGRVAFIRDYLDKNGFSDVAIVAYAAKYASNLYGPFRDAVGSTTNLSGASKSSYQMDFRNHKEAMKEISLDIAQSADIILIKPAIYCLDIIFNASTQFCVPIFAYQVSGEYFMIKQYAHGLNINFAQVALESLLCIKRAGAKSIFSYAALEVAKFLR